MKQAAIWLALLALAACGDPLAEIERLSEVAVPADAGAANVGPTPQEAAGEGFIGAILRGDAATGVSAEGEVTPEAPAPEAPETEAPEPEAPEPEAPGRQSLFGPRVTAPTGPDAARVAPGTVLPGGQIATVCGLPEPALGAPIGAASGYAIRDTVPNTVEPRTHFLTGFPDGCARQFTAALALFGDVGTHEVVRYLASNAEVPYSATDTAYEQIKADVCGVPAGQPCGSRLDRLARRTVFVTVYQNFGTNPSWANILIHDGVVVAMDTVEG